MTLAYSLPMIDLCAEKGQAHERFVALRPTHSESAQQSSRENVPQALLGPVHETLLNPSRRCSASVQELTKGNKSTCNEDGLGNELIGWPTGKKSRQSVFKKLLAYAQA